MTEEECQKAIAIVKLDPSLSSRERAEAMVFLMAQRTITVIADRIRAERQQEELEIASLIYYGRITNAQPV